MNSRPWPFETQDLQEPGSQWLLANLHTHTPGSSDFYKPEAETYRRAPIEGARALLNACLEKEISIVALTDHNSPSFIWPVGAKHADPGAGSYYSLARQLVAEDEQYAGLLVLPGVEIGAENIHVLGVFSPSEDPEWDVIRIAAILEQGGCRPEVWGNAVASCTDYSVADAIDVVHANGGLAVPAHIDAASGFLMEESQARLLRTILSRPHLTALEYVKDDARKKLARVLKEKKWRTLIESRAEWPLAWLKGSDSHFYTSTDGKGNGEALGTVGRRTRVKLDPTRLTFDALQGAILDPGNRVRVDETAAPQGRQGAFQDYPKNRTYLRAMKLDWGHTKDTVRFNRGANFLLGPTGSGKTSRLQAVSAGGGARQSLTRLERPVPAPAGAATTGNDLQSVDLLLSTGEGLEARWWLHRDAQSPDEVFVAHLGPGAWPSLSAAVTGEVVPLPTGAAFNHRAVRTFVEAQAKAANTSGTVPRVYQQVEARQLLASPVRIGRFLDWHYMPEDTIPAHRSLYDRLGQITEEAPGRQVSEVVGDLTGVYQQLRPLRQKAIERLNAAYAGTSPGLEAVHENGAWETGNSLREAVEQLVGGGLDRDGVFSVLSGIEDAVSLTLYVHDSQNGDDVAVTPALADTLKGMLLVLGAHDLGPIILDAPGSVFDPKELAEMFAPAVLRARDAGVQFIVATADHLLPVAADGENLLVCTRDRATGGMGAIDAEACGGLDNPSTAQWCVENLEGGCSLAEHRQRFYTAILAAERASRQAAYARALAATKAKQ